MEILIRFSAGIVGKIGECTIVPIGRQLGYMFYYRRNIEKLRKQTQQLRDAKERLEHSIDEARKRDEEIEGDVQSWLSEVDKISEEIENFLREEGQANTGCSWGSFPNLVMRHQLSRKAKKMAHTVVGIKDGGKFDKVSYLPNRQTIFEIKGYMAFETRNSTLMGIMEALGDGNVALVGVSGMAGVGKTTLVKEVARRALEQKLFSDAVEVTASQTPNHHSIQKEIAEKLGLQFQGDGMRIRADQLKNRLKQEKNFLIILDDVWKKLDLSDIGISFDDDQKGCKILLTSRSENVLCNHMDVQKNFPVELISENEAHIWFNNIVGDLSRNSDIQSLASQIVKECAGLPVAITTVAHALKNKSLSLWKDALRQLKRNSLVNIEGMNEKVYSSIKLSYDFLEIEEAKQLFLLCSLHEEDSIILSEVLMRYAMGCGLINGINTLEEARDSLHSLIDKLKAHSLLLDIGDGRSWVKMHDVIRDVGISIASNERHMYAFKNNDDLRECMRKNKLKDSTSIFFLYGYADQLPERLECNRLLLLRVITGGVKVQISDAFFEKMEEVRVLDLSFTDLNVQLPSSYDVLQNLQVLCLRMCSISNISLLGKLHSLEILDLSESSIVELPEQIGQLSYLRMLDLTNCLHLKVIQPNVISSLTRLEELYMNTFGEWEVEVVHGVRSNACLTELENLDRLTSFSLHVKDASTFPKGMIGEKTKRYHVSVGIFGGWYQNISRALALKATESNVLHQNDLGILLKNSEVLGLEELDGASCVIPDFDREGLPQLKHLHFRNNQNMVYIINSGVQIFPCINAFPILEAIILESMMSLQKICHGKLSVESFGRLKFFQVKDCGELKNLFSYSIARNLSLLEMIEVSSCEVMEEIITHEREDNYVSNEKIEFPQLTSLTLTSMPNLARFCSELNKTNTSGKREEIPIADHSSIPFFNGKIISFPKLSSLNLSSVSSSESEKTWDTHLLASSIGFQNLVWLTLENCGFLKNLFSSSVATNLAQLHSLKIRNCKRMEEIITCSSTGEMVDKVSLHKLNELWLEDLPCLTRFSADKMFIEFPSLIELTIENCHKLETFVSNCTSCPNIEVNKEKRERNMEEKAILSLFNEKVALPSLKNMKLNWMNNLKLIWDQYKLDKDSFYKLEDITVRNCNNLRKVFPNNMLSRLLNMQNLEIIASRRVNMVFEIETSNAADQPIRATPLRTINLICLRKLRHVWSEDPKRMLTFPNIKSFYIDQCPKLESIFPLSMAKSLLQLEYIRLEEHGIHEIVRKVEGLETMPTFVFPHINKLELLRLPNLVSFYHGLHSSKWPSVETLEVVACKNVKVFASEICAFKESSELVHHDTIDQPLFLIEKDTFPSLKELNIRYTEKLKSIWKNQPTMECFLNMESITVEDCKNLTEIIAKDKRYEKKPNFVLPHLVRLKLLKLNKLVGFYPGLHTSDWPSLVELELSGIKNVKVLASDLKSFQEPRLLANQEIPIHQYLFLMDKVAFPNLKILKLNSMNTMKMIWQDQASAASFPQLEVICIQDCKNLMEVFPSSNNIPLMLTSSQVDNGEEELEVQRSDVDHQGSCSRGILAFGNLSQVYIDGCSRLKSLIPLSVAKNNLLQLKDLHVKNSRVREIIAKDKEEEESAEIMPMSMIPQLTCLVLENLPAYVRFCPGPYAIHELWPGLKIR